MRRGSFRCEAVFTGFVTIIGIENRLDPVVPLVRRDAPSRSRDRLDLWAKFHRHGYETKGWPAEVGSDPGILLENFFRIEEWTYYVGNRLVAVAYVDALPEGLSAIYCYYDDARRAPVRWGCSTS